MKLKKKDNVKKKREHATLRYPNYSTLFSLLRKMKKKKNCGRVSTYESALKPRVRRPYVLVEIFQVPIKRKIKVKENNTYVKSTLQFQIHRWILFWHINGLDNITGNIQLPNWSIGLSFFKWVHVITFILICLVSFFFFLLCRFLYHRCSQLKKDQWTLLITHSQRLSLLL